MTPRKRLKIFQRFAEHDPHPKTELQHGSVFELLISVILSAQATDKSVNIATAKLFPVANTPAQLLALGEANLKNYIKNIGLANTKAKNIIKTCEVLMTQHDGQVPREREALEKLFGVGRKTANVILNTAFDEPTIAVDTHIFRVGNRTKIAPGTTPLAVEKGLLAAVPKKYLKNAHHWLVLHGRYICIARKPHCAQCIISDLCEYDEKNCS